MSDLLLEVHGLHAGYGPIEVLHGLDLSVERGGFAVILGANGAGKTTTMRALSGMLARRGEVSFDGHDISKSSPEAIVRLGIAQVPQGRGTFPELSVEDNLRAGAYIRTDGDAIGDDVERWFTNFPRLRERSSQRAGTLSGGEQQMLAIARALMSRPKLLLCDEPSLGLSPLITQELFAALHRLNVEEGLSILLVEQNANLAVKIASQVYLLETGAIVGAGTAEEISRDDSIRRAYLGY
ncbi:MAG: ABC transporter ATP-binding protein [Actinomycetota bacterium]|jgi:branched-chain amino acid transport system ATP-binding protein